VSEATSASYVLYLFSRNAWFWLTLVVCANEPLRAPLETILST
jgi:hypothetical protein